jgi:predicted amidohydrolase
MIIAAAQTMPRDGDIAGNLGDHDRLTEHAADCGAQLIVFPELSITGYLIKGADKFSFAPNDTRLNRLQVLANKRNITIVAGAPVRLPIGLCISSFIIRPNNRISIYTKQFLHTGEEEVYMPGFDNNPQLEIGGETVSFAICADISNPLHPDNASKRKTTLYIASIFFRPVSIGQAHGLLSSYAKKYSMNVLMANYGGPSSATDAGGHSAFWTSTGECIATTDRAGEAVLVVAKENGQWMNRSTIA